jgi:genome maintenance exonuclease 1
MERRSEQDQIAVGPGQYHQRSMRFEHATPIDLGYSSLHVETTEIERTYAAPSGKKYPSITTVLGIRNKGFLQEWRARVGAEEAKRVSTRAANRGSQCHDLLERYLNNEEINTSKLMPHIAQGFNAAKRVLDKYVGKVIMQETALYSDHLRVGGRVDLIAEFNGKTSIIDFKTSNRVKTRDDISNYFIQECAYAIMCEERTGIPVSRLVTIMLVDGRDSPLVFVENRDTWAPELISAILEYEKAKMFGHA